MLGVASMRPDDLPLQDLSWAASQKWGHISTNGRQKNLDSYDMARIWLGSDLQVSALRSASPYNCERTAARGEISGRRHQEIKGFESSVVVQNRFVSFVPSISRLPRRFSPCAFHSVYHLSRRT